MKIFLDVGAYKGALSRRAVESGLYDEVHAFEPTGIDVPGIHCHAWAVGNTHGAVPFFRSVGNGSSLFFDKTTGDIRNSDDVECVRLSSFMAMSAGWSEIDLHLDCEGAEYLILPDLFVTSMIDRITRLSVEWHGEKIPSIHKGFDASLRALVASLGKPECLVRE